MERKYKSFEEIRELVTKKYKPLSECPWQYLNEQGRFIHDVYDELDNCFFCADNLAEYVENVSVAIKLLLKTDWFWSPETVEHKAKVAEKLRKFVRFQIERELWENITEFADRKEN